MPPLPLKPWTIDSFCSIESVIDEQIKFVGEQLGKIANALEQFIADKTPHLYKEVMSMEVEGFDDNFLCSVSDYIVGREFEAKAFLAKCTKHRKIWLQKFLKVEDIDTTSYALGQY
ncbi:hypothetical protein PVK06_008308 [Gossypium arboreum]|uniref:Uncharacterized protein n=1 Tax=Gossypium arboreum TaxID=29729 RepID=A0ABR0QJY6_GOSAR|nr:hypothetical protein PVK06_008308 [Gossypium arboreum]